MLSVLSPSIRPQYLDITQRCLEAQTFQDFEWLVEVGLHNRGFTLPSDMNKMLRRARGDTILILQDCITIEPTALQAVAALSHDRIAYTYPVSKDGKYDWRKTRLKATGNPEITGNMWETDLASAPLSLFKEIGGYDEDFDKGWSWDNVEVGWRAVAAGYKLMLSNEIEGAAVDHDREVEHPWRNKLENNDKRANQTRIDAEHGKWKLSFV